MRPRIKICGLTRVADARLARELGAAFFGVVLYAKSPRYVEGKALESIISAIPKGQRVAVEVSPEPGTLATRRAQGFDFFQVHYDPREHSAAMLKAWADEIGRAHLWLAPRLPPGEDFPASALKVAQTLLLDTYQKGTYGGTGRTGDWSHFKALAKAHPKHHWVLSGGLRPENVRAAVRATGAQIVDVNSGIESAPGLKDAALMDLLFANLAGD
jgi:phosphoribosylanthranilate isomerase